MEEPVKVSDASIEENIRKEISDEKIEIEEPNTKLSMKNKIKNRLKNIKVPIIHDYIRVLFTNSSFFCLFCSGSISQAGNFFSEIAIMTKVEEFFADTPHQGIALSLVFVAIFLPNLLLSPIAGTIADLADRRVIMFLMDFIRVILVGCYILAENNFYVLMGLVVLVESANAIFDPARESMVPMVIPKEDLQISNAIESLSWFCCSMLGSALGGFFTAQFGVRACFIADAVSFLLSGILAILLFFTPELKDYKLIMKHGVDKVREMKSKEKLEKGEGEYELLEDDIEITNEKIKEKVQPTEQEEEKESDESTEIEEEVEKRDEEEKKNIPKKNLCLRLISGVKMSIVELCRGVAFLLSNPFILIVASIRGLASFQWACSKFANVKYSDHVYVIGSSPAIFMSITRALLGASSGMTPILVERIIKPSSIHQFLVIILIAIFVSLLGDIIMSAAPHVSIYLIGATIEAMGGGVIWVFSSTIQQKLVPTNFLGRCFSYDIGIMVMSGFLFGGIICGVLYDFAGFTPRMLSILTTVYSFLLVIFWCLFYLIFRKHANTYQPFIPTTTFPFVKYEKWSIFGAASKKGDDEESAEIKEE